MIRSRHFTPFIFLFFFFYSFSLFFLFFVLNNAVLIFVGDMPPRDIELQEFFVFCSKVTQRCSEFFFFCYCFTCTLVHWQHTHTGIR